MQDFEIGDVFYYYNSIGIIAGREETSDVELGYDDADPDNPDEFTQFFVMLLYPKYQEMYIADYDDDAMPITKYQAIQFVFTRKLT